MANKERNKRSARKARAEERAQRDPFRLKLFLKLAKATKVEAKKQEKSIQRNANLASWPPGCLFCRRSHRNAPRCVAFKPGACWFLCVSNCNNHFLLAW